MSKQWEVKKGTVVALIRLCWMISFLCLMNRNVACSDFCLTLRHLSIPFLRSSHPSLPTSCCSLLCLAVRWVLTETCCLGSSIMHPLPRDIMCDKWPISVQTPIGPWPGGVGVCASVRKSVYICLFVYESRLAVRVRKWDDEGRFALYRIKISCVCSLSVSEWTSGADVSPPATTVSILCSP